MKVIYVVTVVVVSPRELSPRPCPAHTQKEGAPYASPNMRRTRNKVQKESTTVGLEPTTLASQIIGGLRATICFGLVLDITKNTSGELTAPGSLIS